MSSVGTGDRAASAPDTFAEVEFGIDDRVSLKDVCRVADIFQSDAFNLFDVIKPFLGQIQVQACLQVVNNAVAVLHDGRGDLDAARSHHDKFQRVRPALHASHGAQVHILQGRIVPHLRDKPQRDRLDGIAAVSAHRGHSVDCRRGNISVLVDADDALDRIDRGDPVRSPAHCRFRCGAHSGYVGSELGEDRYAGAASGRRREPLHELRHLADVGSKASLRHIGAGEIQFDRVRAVAFTQAGQMLPVLLILSHDGSQNKFLRIFFFEAAEDLHVLLDAVVRELLYILKSDDAPVVACDR